MSDYKKLMESNTMEAIPEVEYTPAQEVEPTTSEASNPTNEIPEVVYAKKESIGEKLNNGIRGVYQSTAQAVANARETRKAQKQAEMNSQVSPVKSYGRQIKAGNPTMFSSPSSPVIQEHHRQVMNAPRHASSAEMVYSRQPQLSPLQRMMATGNRPMESKGKQQLSPMQKMLMGGNGKPHEALSVGFGGKGMNLFDSGKGKSPILKIMQGKSKKFKW